MADRVIANSRDLRQFASTLGQVNSDLNNLEGKLRSAINQVSQTWKDPQRDKCQREIESLSRNLRAFRDGAEQQRQYCLRLAGQIESIG